MNCWLAQVRKNMTELQLEIRKWKKRRTSEIRTHQKEQELMKKNLLNEIRNLPAQVHQLYPKWLLLRIKKVTILACIFYLLKMTFFISHQNDVIHIMWSCFKMQLRNMTTHYNELNDIHNDLFMLATETLDSKLDNFTNQINRYHEERSLRLTVGKLSKMSKFMLRCATVLAST